MRAAGLRAEDIHKWIDGYFDEEGFSRFLASGASRGFDPYEHRRHRHCVEALEEAYREFAGKYKKKDIKAVFERHLMDDYQGYLPRRADFDDAAFREKYHKAQDSSQGVAPQSDDGILSARELEEYFEASAKKGKGKGRALGIPARIIIPVLAALALTSLTITAYVLPAFHEAMMEGKREMIRELTLEAASVASYHMARARSGEASLEAAQALAMEEIGRMRYGVAGKDYLFITDMTPVMLMHPYRPDLVGKDLSGYRDVEDRSGKLIFAEFARMVRERGEGYLSYHWQWMDDPGRSALKLSYVRGIPEWGWILGTGVYIDDIEQGIARIGSELGAAFGAIALILAALVAWLVSKSGEMERARLRAEAGLREAKERYRSLVEASNEGHALVIDGEIVYANRTLRRMLDAEEGAIIGKPVSGILDAGAPGSAELLKAIEGRSEPGRPPPAEVELEARVITASGGAAEALARVSRVFFPDRNGYLLSFRPIAPAKHFGLESAQALAGFGAEAAGALVLEIDASATAGHVVQVLNRLPALVRGLTESGSRPEALRAAIGRLYEAACRRFIALSLDEAGPPPLPFAFLNLGSNARKEMSFFSDQDNALVFDDPPPGTLEKVRRYYLRLAESVSAKLRQGGYDHCPGGIMAMNPAWCLSASEWADRIKGWIGAPEPDAILKVNVAADIATVYGDEWLAESLKGTLFSQASASPEFFRQFALHCVSQKIGLDLLGRPMTAEVDGKRSLNLKRCLKPIEGLARIYALKEGVRPPSTLDRIRELSSIGALREDSAREIAYVFEYLWMLRFRNQLKAHAELSKVDDELEPADLTDTERRNLKNVLGKVELFQRTLAFDFLGSAL